MANDVKQMSEEQQRQMLFFMLVQQHEQIALMGLGEVENPESGQKQKDMSAAKYAIDTLEMLEMYTKGNLSAEMKEYLTHTLTQLRLQFADVKKSESGGGQ